MSVVLVMHIISCGLSDVVIEGQGELGRKSQTRANWWDSRTPEAYERVDRTIREVKTQSIVVTKWLEVVVSTASLA